MDDRDLQGLERELARLPDVSIARVVAKPSGGVAEIHVVALPGKPPKQVARDVESVALASFGLRLDRRTISVVQLEERDLRARATRAPDHPTDPEVPATTPETAGYGRPALLSVDEHSDTAHTRIAVVLGEAGAQVHGEAEGSIASVAHGRIVAEAVLCALRHLSPRAGDVAVDTAHVLPVGRTHVAVVTLALLDAPTEHQLVGTAVVHSNRDAEALARAVLDATNRRLGLPA
ncbi:MAG: hypothetical protein M5U31_07940 [Acidimicrobiia bacterium]|nr:hypothetical protein [Acidimicrobiia bacterium]